MIDPGRVSLHTLSDGRMLEYWEGGDPDGRPVIQHEGTPTTYALAMTEHDVAVDLGVRLVCLNRPGYGRSTPSVPSLASSARDTVELTRELALDSYALVGVSGGGPFAAATAVLDAERVRVLGVVDAIGPWTELLPPTEADAEERAMLASIGEGGVAEIRPAFLAMAEAELGGLRDLDDDARVDAFLGQLDASIASDPAVRRTWASNLRLVLDGPYGLQGYTDDNLAWGGPWDVDPAAVTAPTLLWFRGDEAGQATVHGQWYADRIPGARLTVFPGANHLEVCSGQWPQIFADLLHVGWPA